MQWKLPTIKLKIERQECLEIVQQNLSWHFKEQKRKRGKILNKKIFEKFLHKKKDFQWSVWRENINRSLRRKISLENSRKRNTIPWYNSTVKIIFLKYNKRPENISQERFPLQFAYDSLNSKSVSLKTTMIYMTRLKGREIFCEWVLSFWQGRKHKKGTRIRKRRKSIHAPDE